MGSIEAGSGLESIQAILNTLDGLVYVSDIDTHEMIFMNRFGETHWGIWGGRRCWEVLQAGQSGPCDFCTNHLLRRPDKQPAGLHVWEFRNTITGRWYECRDQAIRWVDGRIVRMEVAFDITERRAGQAIREELERKTRDAQRMVSLGTLARGVAHEFNNILGTILGNAELAASEVSTDPVTSECLSEIRSTSLRARDIVARIRQFSQQPSTTAQPIHLQPLVEEAWKHFSGMIPAKIVASLDMPKEPLFVVAVAADLNQALLNICTNAWQSFKGRSGRVSLCVERVLITEASYSEAGDIDESPHVRITLCDSGCGMDPDTKARAFEPFFTTRPVRGATGLGLSIAQSIIRSQGGTIEIDSQPGVGTSVCLCLPLASNLESVPINKTAELPAEAGAGGHVLLVDDDESLLRLISRQLQRLGHEVTAFDDARSAIRRLEAPIVPFDMLVTDYNMPGITGIELAQFCRVHHPRIPMLMLSGCVTEEMRSDAASAGIETILEKPHTAAELGSQIDSLLRVRQVAPH